MALYFSYRIFVNQWANLNTFINAVTYGQPSDTLRQTLCKPVVDTGLHQKTVGTYTGLTGIAELGLHCALNCGFNIRIIKDDKWRVTPSSSDTRFSVGAHCAINKRPIGVEPVKESFLTTSLFVNSPPMIFASPVTICRTPAGIPARIASSPNANAVRGFVLLV